MARKLDTTPEQMTMPAAPPPLILSAAEEQRLAGLAEAAASRNPTVSALLLREIERAQVMPAEAVPPDVVTMHAHVAYRDEATGETRAVQLVYPHEADIAAGRVSVLTLIGAALLGLAAGQSILCPTQDGRERQLTVLEVSHDPITGAG